MDLMLFALSLVMIQHALITTQHVYQAVVRILHYLAAFLPALLPVPVHLLQAVQAAAVHFVLLEIFLVAVVLTLLVLMDQILRGALVIIQNVLLLEVYL